MATQRSGVNFSLDKFKCFVRYMILAAKDKRCVTYYELENSFGLSHKGVGYYAGQLGDYCSDMKFPLLNGLIISSTNSCPSKGFDWYQKEYGKSWGEIVTECWKYFHITSSREKQVKDFAGLDSSIVKFLSD